MFKKLITTTKDAVSSAKKSLVETATSKVENLKTVDVRELTKNKLKNMNYSVIKEWVGDNDAPDERSFRDKISSSAKKMGEEVAVVGIKSWLAMTDPKTDIQHKAILGTALAYLVLPADMIPDMIAGVGFTDDLAALTLAVKSVSSSITDEHEKRARQKWEDL